LIECRRQLAVACLELREQPHVLDRDHGLIGEGLQEGDFVVSKPPEVVTGNRDRPDRLVATEQRHHNRASVAPDTCGGAPVLGPSRIGMGIENIERRAGEYGLGVPVLGVERPWEGCPHHSVASGVGASERGELNLIARDPCQQTGVRPQQVNGAVHDRVEHRLHVARGLADHLENLARCGLLIECGREIAIARVQLFEQPHVLDGDDRLVGEGLEQRDVHLGEWCHVRVPDLDDADRLAAS
jgi:hypothetical protein